MSTSQAEVRTALVEFLTTLTKILKTVDPLIKIAVDETMQQKFPVKVSKHSKNVIGSSLADEDEVPF